MSTIIIQFKCKSKFRDQSLKNSSVVIMPKAQHIANHQRRTPHTVNGKKITIADIREIISFQSRTGFLGFLVRVLVIALAIFLPFYLNTTNKHSIISHRSTPIATRAAVHAPRTMSHSVLVIRSYPFSNKPL